MTNVKLTDFVNRWVSIDALLSDQNESSPTLGEIRAAVENTSRDEDAALLIIAMRLVSSQVFRVYQGGLN
jgi:hypothetical protein